MRAPVAIVNRVGVSINLLVVAVIVLHRDVHSNQLLRGLFVGGDLADKVDGLGLEALLGAVEPGHILGSPQVKLEDLALARAFVLELDVDAGVQEGKFTQALGQYLVLELALGDKDLCVAQEGDLSARCLSRTGHLQGLHHRASGKAHFVDVAIAADLSLKPLTDGIDAACTHPVQATRDLVTSLAKLAAGVQLSQHHLDTGLAVVLVDFDRDPAPVILDRTRPVHVDRHRDLRAVPGQVLIHAVVDNLKHTVVQSAAIGRVSDVHARALADGLQALQLAK